jgi:hypothetical protein
LKPNSAVSDGIKAIISPTNGPIAPRYGPTDKAILDMDLAKDLLSRSPDNPIKNIHKVNKFVVI